MLFLKISLLIVLGIEMLGNLINADDNVYMSIIAQTILTALFLGVLFAM